MYKCQGLKVRNFCSKFLVTRCCGQNSSVKDFQFSTVASEDAEVSEVSDEKLTLPQPFINPSIINSNKRTVVYNAKEEILRHPTFSDEDAINFSDKYPSSGPVNPYTLPFPLRMGKNMRLTLQPDQFANLELAKINNFLHLTPPAITKQCKALKEFCTEFPPELMNDVELEKEYPVELYTVDYLGSGKSPINLKARIVEKKIRVCNLVVDAHARTKLLSLATKKRYNRETDMLSLVSNRMPLRKQNADYIDYLLTVLYTEAWKKEKWENRKFTDNDGEEGVFWWTESESFKNVKRVVDAKKSAAATNANSDDQAQSQEESFIEDLPEIKEYMEAVTKIKLEAKPYEKFKYTPERRELVEDYKTAVIKVLGLEHVTLEAAEAAAEAEAAAAEAVAAKAAAEAVAATETVAASEIAAAIEENAAEPTAEPAAEPAAEPVELPKDGTTTES